jgi:copper oxidase (laccase) domain-containing protein
MGPAIAGSVYQVDQGVAAEVGASLFPDVPKPPTEILEILANLTEPPILSDPEAGKVRLDVRRINALQLDQLDLQPDQIAIAPYCTYQMSEHFFSYRRTHEKKVQWSGIISGQGK